YLCILTFVFFSSRRRHTRSKRDWSSDVCSSDLRSTRIRHPHLDRQRDEHLRFEQCTDINPGALLIRNRFERKLQGYIYNPPHNPSVCPLLVLLSKITFLLLFLLSKKL